MSGFTRQEQCAILFLLATFGIGCAILFYRRNLPPPPVDRALLDSLRVQVSHFAPDTVRTVQPETRPHTKAPINLNTATFEDLVRLPGIGEVIAKRILAYRAEHGKFSRLEDLIKVKGLGKTKVAALKEHVAVK